MVPLKIAYILPPAVNSAKPLGYVAFMTAVWVGLAFGFCPDASAAKEDHAKRRRPTSYRQYYHAHGGEIRVFYDYVTADGRLEGGKGKMNDAGTSVPLIASWPGLSPAGKVLDDLIDFSYFFPTLCEAARCQLPKDRIIDGRTFFPQVVGHKSMPREWVFCHYWKNGRTREGVQEFARDTRWKLYDDSKLYDIKNDLLEDSPLGETEEVTTVRKRLQAALVAARIGP